MSAAVSFQAPAKLNLFLHVVGRRSDGYHLLQSVFVPIDWYDTIALQIRADGQLKRTVISNQTDIVFSDEDLCTQAANLLRLHTGFAQGVQIDLHKRIPAQAGLGGGSSDAATVMLGLNSLLNLKLSRAELAELGLQLGADVPFFVYGKPAWVEGIGEQITPLPEGVLVQHQRFLVLKPAAGVATPQIFRDSRLKRDTAPATIMGFAAHPTGFGCNDLQALACELCPPVQDALNWLQNHGFTGARMSGSGSAVFAPLAVPLSQFQQEALQNLPVGWRAKNCGLVDVVGTMSSV